ncbi:hypothetical protein SAMN02927924_01385 [Sphingobium faniae]|nr:hypothetical protein SAMN02927924_01385 [Sphingobium faniae]
MGRYRNRNKAVALAALGGGGAALAMLSMPVGLVETLIASTGVSEILPAAAPPLGMTARLGLALFAALMAIGIIGVMRREGRLLALEHEGRSDGVRGAGKMGFALSRLTAFARRRERSSDRFGEPVLRRADAHPDAPARAPIFASRDFDGLDIFGRNKTSRPVEVEEDAQALAQEAGALGLTLPNGSEPLSGEELPESGGLPLSGGAVPMEEADFSEEPAEETGSFAVAEAQEEPVIFCPAETTPVSSIERLSITELTARLERGLAERARVRDAAGSHRVIADMPVAAAVPVRDAVVEDIDAALRDALGTLRTMAGRAG